jgi:UDP-glucose 4-epimerase
MRDTILVTGGAGLLGSHIADCLIEAGNDVIVMDDLSGGFQDNVHPDTQFIQGSILDHDLVDSIFARHRSRKSLAPIHRLTKSASFSGAVRQLC